MNNGTSWKHVQFLQNTKSLQNSNEPVERQHQQNYVRTWGTCWLVETPMLKIRCSAWKQISLLFVLRHRCNLSIHRWVFSLSYLWTRKNIRGLLSLQNKPVDQTIFKFYMDKARSFCCLECAENFQSLFRAKLCIVHKCTLGFFTELRSVGVGFVLDLPFTPSSPTLISVYTTPSAFWNRKWDHFDHCCELFRSHAMTGIYHFSFPETVSNKFLLLTSVFAQSKAKQSTDNTKQSCISCRDKNGWHQFLSVWKSTLSCDFHTKLLRAEPGDKTLCNKFRSLHKRETYVWISAK